MRNFIIYLVLFAGLFASCGNNNDSSKKDDAPAKAEIVTVYTHRHYESDQELFDKFTEETGIEVKVVNAKADELIIQIQKEGDKCPADLLFTVDAGRLVRTKERDLLQSVSDSELDARIPPKYRDPEGMWYGLTKRARVMVYNPETMSDSDFSTYEDLTDPKFNNSIVVRSSGNIYNQSLMASIIANSNTKEAENWAKGLVNNMARSPQGNDRDQIKAVYHGDAKVAIANSYYLGKMINSKDPAEVEVGNAMKIFFPNQNTTGTHINISGAGVCKHSPNKDNAIKLLKFLGSVKSQELFSAYNYEYPVHSKAKKSELLESWGEFKEDPLNISILGELNKQAVKVMDAAGWK